MALNARLPSTVSPPSRATVSPGPRLRGLALPDVASEPLRSFDLAGGTLCRLESLQSGWIALGTQTQKSGCDMLSDGLFGPDVLECAAPGETGPLRPDAPRFDVVRAFFALESTPTPRRVLRSLAGMARPGGRIGAAMLVVSGSLAEDYRFQSRARRAGLYLLRRAEVDALAGALEPAMVIKTPANSPDPHALGRELAARIESEPVPLYLVTLSGRRGG